MPRSFSRRSDSELVRMCLEGNELAWTTLIDRYARLIYSVPSSYRIPPQDAADIFQAVCVELHTALPRLRETAALRRWLVTVASHECYRWKQRLARSPEEPGEAPDYAAPGESESLLLELERQDILRQAIEELAPRCREMVRLLFFHDPPLPYAEVAARLELAVGSIGFIRGRCLRKLRENLDRLGF